MSFDIIVSILIRGSGTGTIYNLRSFALVESINHQSFKLILNGFCRIMEFGSPLVLPSLAINEILKPGNVSAGAINYEWVWSHLLYGKEYLILSFAGERMMEGYITC